jgi:uncharacterized protein (DUF1330 family)
MNTPTAPKAYAFCHLTEVDFGAEIIEYLERIDATLAPYDGRFIVHGGDAEVAEGELPGDVVIIEFPSPAAARDWWASPAYQEIVHLRTEHSTSTAALLLGVKPGHQATDKLAQLLGQAKSA